MKNWKARITITCVAAVLATILCMSSTPASPARAHEQPVETAGISRLSDVEDGYDAGIGGICYEIVTPTF